MKSLIKRKHLRKYIVLRNRTVGLLRMISIPGSHKQTLYDVLAFFFKGLFEGALTVRASAVSFNFFLAIFPFIIFIFTLIPYIPIHQFQDKLFELFAEVIPPDTFSMVESTIYEIIMKQNSGLLSLSFVLTFLFSTNGISAIIDGFNSTWHNIETRSWVQQRIVAFWLLIVLSLLVIFSIAVITTGGIFIDWMVKKEWIKGAFTIYSLVVLKWFITLSLTYFSVSLLYYYAPAKRKMYRFFSAGSVLATLLLILGTLGFNYYIANFARYNALYGSIGTLIVFMMWLYFNAIILLIGFELNASILRAGLMSQNETSGKRSWK